jgi:hypothetical protein
MARMATKRAGLVFLISALAISLVAARHMRSVGLLLVSFFLLLVLLLASFRRFEKFLLPMAAAVLTLAAFELLAPVVLVAPKNKTYFEVDHYADGYFTNIEGYGPLPTAGVYQWRKLTKDGDVIYDVTYSIGEDGYRRAGRSGPFNYYLYGGSYVFGEGLDDDETLSHFLWADHSMAAKNVGVHGYGLQQALYNITHGITAVKGVNILVTAPWHSLRSACKPLYSLGTPRYVNVNGFAQLDGVCSGSGKSILLKVLARSKVYELVRTVFMNQNEIRDEDVELYLAIIRSIARETRVNGSKLIVALIKATDDQLEHTKYTNESLFDELAKIGDVVIDATLSADRESLPSRYFIHELDQHPSALANRERAGLIAGAIAKLRSEQSHQQRREP